MSNTRYVALLKGVNVGGAKRVAMADLRAMLAGLGYQDVRTHLQSGNAAFTAAGAAAAVRAAVESGLRDVLGVDVRVVVRTHTQLAAAIEADPYPDIAVDPARHLLGFFSAVPDSATISAFEQFVAGRKFDPQTAGRYRIIADHCYLWCPQGVHSSLFAAVDWDRKLGVTVTMRNWSTVTKLLQLSAT